MPPPAIFPEDPGRRPRTLPLLLSPCAPHLAEEPRDALGHPDPLAYEPWPDWDESLTMEAMVTLPVQVNGKVPAG